MEREGKGRQCCQAGRILAEEGMETMEECYEVGRLGGVWWVQSWREDCRDDQTVDRRGWRTRKRNPEGFQNRLERRARARELDVIDLGA